MKGAMVCLVLFFMMGFNLSCDVPQSISGLPGIMDQSNPSGSEISSGLKQALEVGLSQGVKQVSSQDGFFKNALIKVLFPPEAQKVESTLRSIGMGQLVDDVVLSLNRAAEDASKKALPIFMKALKGMSFQDATGILLGADTAATHYFKTATTSELMKSFEPVIANSLQKVDATKYWGTVMTQYNKIPLVKPITTNLNEYVTNKAVDGLFTIVAQKEKGIRNNISDRTTPLLKKVFGYADQKK